MKKTRPNSRPPPHKDTAEYRRIWRVVDGAVADAFKCHPDYLARAEPAVRVSINKRVVGALLAAAVPRGSEES